MRVSVAVVVGFVLCVGEVFGEELEDRIWCDAGAVVIEEAGRMEAQQSERARQKVIQACAAVTLENPEYSACIDSGLQAATKKRLQYSLCQDSSFKRFSNNVQNVCKELTSDANIDKLSKRWTQVAYQPEQIVEQKGDILSDIRHECKELQPTPLPRKGPKDCEACRALIDDAERVITASLGRDHYRTSKHIHDVIDDLCVSLAYRHKEADLFRLNDFCEDLVEDSEELLMDVLAAEEHAELEDELASRRFSKKRICSQDLGVCPKRKKPAKSEL